jgi:hypothetical protein
MGKKDFLKNHFRYYTARSWNQSESFAANVKVYNVVPKHLQDIAYEMAEMEDVHENIRDILREFAEKYDYRWQIGFNGRSSGYLVLYQGERKKSEHKSYCRICGQRNFKTVEETGNNKCGRCGSDARINHTFYDVCTFPGRGTDLEDYDHDIEYLYKVVKHFDETVQKVIAEFIYFCENYQVEEEEILIPKKIKILKHKHEAA